MGNVLTNDCPCSCNMKSGLDHREILMNRQKKYNCNNVFNHNERKAPLKYSKTILLIIVKPLSKNNTQLDNNLPLRLLKSSNLAVIKEHTTSTSVRLNSKAMLKKSQSNPNISLVKNVNKNKHLQLNLSNDKINEHWRVMGISSLISDSQLLSKDPREIMVKGTLNKLIIANLSNTSCSLKVEKYCLLTKVEFEIYKSIENCLLIGRPLQCIQLINVIECKRIDLQCLNISKLQGLFFFYIEIKSNRKGRTQSITNVIKDERRKMIPQVLIQKERQGAFFVFFSSDEYMINQWVCIINYFFIQLQKNNNN